MSAHVYAYLWVSGFSCEPDAIGALAGLAPERVELVGDTTPSGRPVTENTWCSKPPVPPGEEQPDFYISAVVDHIRARPSELAAFLRAHDSGINCVGYFRRLNGGFHMEPQLIARCADLGVSLDFDLYNDDVEDEP